MWWVAKWRYEGVVKHLQMKQAIIEVQQQTIASREDTIQKALEANRQQETRIKHLETVLDTCTTKLREYEQNKAEGPQAKFFRTILGDKVIGHGVSLPPGGRNWVQERFFDDREPDKVYKGQFDELTHFTEEQVDKFYNGALNSMTEEERRNWMRGSWDVRPDPEAKELSKKVDDLVEEAISNRYKQVENTVLINAPEHVQQAFFDSTDPDLTNEERQALITVFVDYAKTLAPEIQAMLNAPYAVETGQPTYRRAWDLAEPPPGQPTFTVEKTDNETGQVITHTGLTKDQVFMLKEVQETCDPAEASGFIDTFLNQKAETPND